MAPTARDLLQILPMLFRSVREDFLQPMVRDRVGFERTVLKKTQDFLIGLDWSAQDRLDRKKMRMIAHTDAHIVAVRTLWLAVRGLVETL